MSLATFKKSPNARLSYSINWATSETYLNDGSSSDTGWLQGDTIVSSTWTITGLDTALVEEGSSYNDVVATIEISAGTTNTNYTLTNLITTASGDIDERSINICVTER